MKNIISLVISFLIAIAGNSYGQIITTVAGTDSAGYNGDNIAATAARISHPSFLTVDDAGNIIFADLDNDRIRKISTDGIIITIAGKGTTGFSGDNGPATAAELNTPFAVAIDGTGNIYFTDDYNNRIRKINTSGIISTIAGTGTGAYSGDNGPATAAEIYSPHGIAIDATGNLYFADLGNKCVRKISTSGIITTIAGQGSSGMGDGGPATAAEFTDPYGIAFDNSGNLYVSEYYGERIRKINAAGIITTVAGTGFAGFAGDNGPATDAKLKAPSGIALDGNGNLFICDLYNNRIRKVSVEGTITTIAGSGSGAYSGDGGPAINAELNAPIGIAIYKNNTYISEFYSSHVRRIQSTVFVKNITKQFAEMEIYPNPSSGRFMVHIVCDRQEQVSLYIMDMAGRRVKEITVATNKPEEVNIDAPAGVYFVTIKTGGITLCKKLIIS